MSHGSSRPFRPAGEGTLWAKVAHLIGDWPARDRRLLSELFEDAGTALQRELLLRALTARRSPAELHAFADEIRGMGDEELYLACTVSAARPLPLAQRFRAEADPLWAMELNGHRFSPRLENRAPPALLVTPPPPRVEPGPKPFFEAESSVVRRRAGAPVSALNDAVKGLGVSYREQPVDTFELTLERALDLAAAALARGIPVPVTLGRRAGELGRQILMLQVAQAGKARAFELHDPFAAETVWANERDLLGRSELPFDSKVWRRITAIALPLPAGQ